MSALCPTCNSVFINREKRFRAPFLVQLSSVRSVQSNWVELSPLFSHVLTLLTHEKRFRFVGFQMSALCPTYNSVLVDYERRFRVPLLSLVQSAQDSCVELSSLLSSCSLSWLHPSVDAGKKLLSLTSVLYKHKEEIAHTLLS